MYRKATAEDTKAVYDLICDMEAKLLPYDAFSDIFEKQVMDDDYYCLLREETGMLKRKWFQMEGKLAVSLVSGNLGKRVVYSPFLRKVEEFPVSSSA